MRAVCAREPRRDGGSLIGAGRLHHEYEKVDGASKFVSRRAKTFYFVPLCEGWAATDGPGHL